ncbi:MAG: hypothetical protein KGJ86_00120 [Chloroflexota bacterium]|nr:hypothetical protein [Chloroflexota bacterium]
MAQATASVANNHLQKSFATAHARGRAAFDAGTPRTACPYENGMASKYRVHWLAGWDEGAHGMHVRDLTGNEQDPALYGLRPSGTYGAERRLPRVR